MLTLFYYNNVYTDKTDMRLPLWQTKREAAGRAYCRKKLIRIKNKQDRVSGLLGYYKWN